MMRSRYAHIQVIGLLIAACDPRVTSLGAQARVQPDAGKPDAGKPDAGEPRTGRYIEAESGTLSSGFTRKVDDTASGDHCIVPPAGMTSEDAPGAARASYRFDVPARATYVIWGRIHGQDVDHNRFWFRVDDGAWTKWRISTGDIWFWDDLHDDIDYAHAHEFSLGAGEHVLELANCVDTVELDRLYITADGDSPPGNDTPCSPPHSIQIGDRCEPSCGSHGATTCVVADCAGKTALAAYDCDVCCLVTP
jgi:hypothetical protein